MRQPVLGWPRGPRAPPTPVSVGLVHSSQLAAPGWCGGCRPPTGCVLARHVRHLPTVRTGHRKQNEGRPRGVAGCAGRGYRPQAWAGSSQAGEEREPRALGTSWGLRGCRLAGAWGSGRGRGGRCRGRRGHLSSRPHKPSSTWSPKPPCAQGPHFMSPALAPWPKQHHGFQ